MKVVLSHAGKQHSYHVAQGLQRTGSLKRFYTSSYLSNLALQKLVNRLGINYLQRRFQNGLGGRFVESAWRFEFPEILMRLAKQDSSKVNMAVLQRDTKFDNWLAGRLPGLDFDTYWGFQGSSLECLKTANRLGKRSVCEMTIAHLPYSKKILEEEVRLQPDWADSIDFSNFPSWYEQRMIEEPEKADYVIAISEYLKQTLLESGIPGSKISVLPLGSDPGIIRYLEEPVSIRNRPLRVLFAGRVTQRKGISYLLDAFSRLNAKDFELHIIGNIHGSGEAFAKYKQFYRYTSGVSQQVLFNMYADYDVLVFPSLLEGFGLVSVEAMSAGLPVITTSHTNAYELIREGENGFVIPIRDSHAIENSLDIIRNLSDEQFNQMRAAARSTALRYSWAAYQDNLGQLLKRIES